MLTTLPPGLARAGYDHSGWTNFERCVAGIISQPTNLLCIDTAAREKLLGSEWKDIDYLDLSLKTRDKARGAPTAPEAFNAMIREMHFTNGADCNTIVIPKYLDTFNVVIAHATELKFNNLGFGDKEAQELLAVARGYCQRGTLKHLDLSENNITIPLEEWASFAGEFAL